MAQPTQVTYQVTRVTADTQFPAGSTPVTGKSVAFSTSSGFSGSVFVPDSVFADKDAVTRLIEDQVRIIAQAQGIAGTVMIP